MAKLICDSCLEVFKIGSLLHEDCCVIAGCEGTLIEIDDILVDVVRKLWEKGIETGYCCGGHLWEEIFLPYISFISTDKKYLNSIKEAISYLTDKFHRVKIDEIVTNKIDGEKIYSFIVKSVPLNETMLEKLESLTEFICLLDEFVEKVEKIVDDD